MEHLRLESISPRDSFDVAVWPGGQTCRLTYDEEGLAQLLEWLKQSGPFFIVLEATGGLERRVAGEVIEAGHQVAVVNPQGESATLPVDKADWPRPIGSTPSCWRSFTNRSRPAPRAPPERKQVDWPPW